MAARLGERPQSITTAHRATKRATGSEQESSPPAAEVAIVLFSGQLGGAETFSASLAAELRKSGVSATVVLIDGRGPLRQRLDALGVPYAVYGATRGREVAYRPWRFAKLVGECGADAAILGWPGYLAGALRLGGYPGVLVAVEHGAQLVEDRSPWHRRLLKRFDWRLGLWATDQHVAVSKFACERLCRSPHTGTPVVIYNGVDACSYRPPARGARRAKDVTVIGVTSRLYTGKGIDVLLRAMKILKTSAVNDPVRLLVAGDGPERPALERLAVELEIQDTVSLVGWVGDVSAFWQQCDIATIPSDTWIETFGMAAVEPMACELPVVATLNGGVCEVVDDGVTGLMVPCGDAAALAAAVARYAADPALRRAHGAAARARVHQRFSIESTAKAYMSVIHAIQGSTKHAARDG